MFEDKVFEVNEQEYILLNTVAANKTKYGIFAKKELLDKNLNNKQIFVDYDVFEIKDVVVDEDGEYDVKLKLVEELDPKTYEVVYNAKKLALEKLSMNV